jgi:hypothetical protein
MLPWRTEAARLGALHHFDPAWGRLERRLDRELRRISLPTGPVEAAPVTEADIAHLPEAVRRYLRFMRVTGRSRDWSFQANLRGRFRFSPGQAWMPMQASQYNSGVDIARIFHMRILLFHMLPLLGRDIYLNGAGRMQGQLFGLATVVDARGPELDLGELVTYLNDAILLAPSMLLSPKVGFTEVDHHRFDVRLDDWGHTVRARVSLDRQGAPVDFSTTDRFVQDPYDRKRHGFVRTRWSTPISEYREVDGHMLPVAGQAVWHLPQGDFAYAKVIFDPGSVQYNRAPAAQCSFEVPGILAGRQQRA